MPPTPKLKAKIINGKITFDNLFQQKLYYDSLKKLESKTVSLTLGEWRNTRSIQENRYYWGVIIRIFEDYIGNKDNQSGDAHEHLTSQFLKYRKKDPITGRYRTYIKSTSDLTTKEFEDYCSTCRTYLNSTFGLCVPQPNEFEIF
jgi:hypothetical protein